MIRNFYSASIAPLLLIALSLAISLRTLLAPPVEFGDGREYILQTQAMVFDFSLSISTEKRAPYWNDTNPFGIVLEEKAKAAHPPASAGFSEEHQQRGGFGSLYPSRDGTFRYVHFWLYSLAVVPFYLVFHFLLPWFSEYRAFTAANLVFLFAPLVALWLRRPGWQSLLYISLLLSSPLTPHLQWAHSELFTLFCIMSAFLLIDSRRWRAVGPLFLGLGAAQNIPVLFFFPLHAWLYLKEERPLTRSVAFYHLLAYAIAAAFPALAMAYSQQSFGTWNMIAALGHADTANIQPKRVLDVFISPIVGALWYFPAAWMGALWGWGKGNRITVVLTCLSVALVAALCCASDNINSAQLSACRYAVWFLGPLYLLPLRNPGAVATSFSGNKFAPGIGLLLSLGILYWLGTFRFLAGEWKMFFSNNRARPEVAALYRRSHYPDDVEALVENIQGSELAKPYSFSGIYIWNLGNNQSLWVVSKRAIKSLRRATLKLAAGSPNRLNEIFDIDPRSLTEFSLVPRRDIHYKVHPVFGSYRLLWVDAAVSNLLGPSVVKLR